MPIQLPSHSRFKISNPIVLDNGIETIGMMKQFSFLDFNNLNSNSIIEYRVSGKRAGRPDLISDDVYGTPQLYWVVIMVNKPREVLRWPKIGSIIYLPSSAVVMSEI